MYSLRCSAHFGSKDEGPSDCIFGTCCELFFGGLIPNMMAIWKLGVRRLWAGIRRFKKSNEID